MRIEKQERVKFTEAMIKKLQKKNQKYYVLDSEVIGLRIYVQISGDISFYLQRYLKEFKYSKKTKLGDWPEMSIAAARKLASVVKADNVQGKDPIIAAAERAKEKTFGEVVNEYEDRKLSNKNSGRSPKSIAGELGNINAWIRGNSKDIGIIKTWKKYRDDLNIASKKLTRINSEIVLEYHSAVSTKSKYTANRMIAQIRKLFNYAAAKGYFTGTNPASLSKKNMNVEMQDHHDYFSTDNMMKIIAAAEKLSKQPQYRVACYAILAALYCGGRPQSEVFNLTVDQIDLVNKTIHYPKSKVGQWTRPINDKMVKHLQMVIDARSNADPVLYYSKEDLRHRYLFPNCRFGEIRRGKRGLRPCKLKSVKEVRKIWHMIKTLAGVEDRDLKSLRHTFAVFCVSCGVSLRVLQKYLGHKTIQTTEIYGAASENFIKQESEKVSAGFNAA